MAYFDSTHSSKTPSLSSDKAPTPTNTLIILIRRSRANFDRAVGALKLQITAHASMEHFVPVKSFGRVLVVFATSTVAADIREYLESDDKAQSNIKVYYGEDTLLHTTEQQLLHPPQLEKNWLISPPGSPPVGWQQTTEDPPNKHVMPLDLSAALHHITSSDRHNKIEHDAESDLDMDIPITPVSEHHTRQRAPSEMVLLENDADGPGVRIVLQDWDDGVQLQTNHQLQHTAMPPKH